MSVSIKVAIRCRPFTKADKLGVYMLQTSEEAGEVNLLNSKYTTTRFAFSYSWWSAYGYERHLLDDPPEAPDMTLIDQITVYDSVGQKIKADLFDGNAIVLFAYGLSGSGKTFTVFGPDAPDIPEAWFKHADPHPLWGLFPRLAYDIFNLKEDGWKVTMKYFQNVVDTVRDLMSPVAQEQHYKSGMRKDQDGFMDIQWCGSQILNNWDDLRKKFTESNARKAIAPTQFNHQSTRGHCIMTLEVEMPHPTQAGMKQRGRVYVCDLAGTEPAGDIVYANYNKKVFENGDIEYEFLGAHKDQKKTKELQDQGKKINLSLSEMAQFFMKMAEAVKKKKLKPGKSIPGCNSYFLCKYLKDTMLQARTYLFCAIRPEVSFLNYTFSTLGFAKNASVIKLQPKKAIAAATPAERKLMAELESMKSLVEELKKQNQALSGGTGSTEDIDKIQDMLAAKQKELINVMSGNETSNINESNALMERQKEEYGRRGISLTHYAEGTKFPYLINLDEDPFRSNRFMYLLKKKLTIFGPKGDIQPMSLNIIKEHCMIEREIEFKNDNDEINDEEVDDEFTKIYLIGGKGETYHNGELIKENDKVLLNPYDRIAMGGELMLFYYPNHNPDDIDPPTPEDAINEYQTATQSQNTQQQMEFEQRMKLFEEEKLKWEDERKRTGEQVLQEEELRKIEMERAMQVVDREILELLPKTVELKKIVDIMERSALDFEVILQKTDDELGLPKVKVAVHNRNSDNQSISIDSFEFIKGFSILKDELVHLRNAIENDREFTLPEHHDPVTLLFDNTFHIGTATIFAETMIYNLESEPDEIFQDIRNASVPYNTIGKLEVQWIPLPREDIDSDDEEWKNEKIEEIDDESSLLGKPWTYKVIIKGATALPVITDMAYCQYEFFGQLYTTETVEQDTHNPTWDYSFIHHIPNVTQEFIDFLYKPLEINIYVSPLVMEKLEPVSTTNQKIVNNILYGVGNNKDGEINENKKDDNNILIEKINLLENENNELKNKIKLLEKKIINMGGNIENDDIPITKKRLNEAIENDLKYNDEEIKEPN